MLVVPRGSRRDGAIGTATASAFAFATGLSEAGAGGREATTRRFAMTGSMKTRNGRWRAITIPARIAASSRTKTITSLPTICRSAPLTAVPIRPPPRTGRNSSRPRNAM